LPSGANKSILDHALCLAVYVSHLHTDG